MRQFPADSMFKCEICGQVTPPRTPAHKITTTTRSTTYPRREKVFSCRKRQPNGTIKSIRTNDPGGCGRETVHELTACPSCAHKHLSARRHAP